MKLIQELLTLFEGAMSEVDATLSRHKIRDTDKTAVFDKFAKAKDKRHFKELVGDTTASSEYDKVYDDLDRLRKKKQRTPMVRRPMSEGFDPTVPITLNRLIQRGAKNPDKFELLVLCKILQSFKTGYADFGNIGTFLAGGSSQVPTDGGLMAVLKGLQQEQLLKVAIQASRSIYSTNVGHLVSTEDYLPWLQRMMASEATD